MVELGLLVFMISVFVFGVHQIRRLRAMNFECPDCRQYGTACDAHWEKVS